MQTGYLLLNRNAPLKVLFLTRITISLDFEIYNILRMFRIFFDDFSVNSTKGKEKSTIKPRESNKKLKVDT